MDGWEIGLLAVATYFAVRALVGMMLARRNMVYQRLLKQAEAEQQRAMQEADAQADQQSAKSAA